MSETSTVLKQTSVPPELGDRLGTIVELTDQFCHEHLNDRYAEICRNLATTVCQSGLRIDRGKPAGWAAGIVSAAGWVNFLTDPANDPHMRAKDIAKGFSVSSATQSNKSLQIREALDLLPADPRFCLITFAEALAKIAMLSEHEFAELCDDLEAVLAQIEVNKLLKRSHDNPAPKRRSSRRQKPQTGLAMKFKITLNGTKPPIWRRIVVEDCTLWQFHHYIQGAFGWENAHLYAFRIDGVSYSSSDPMDDWFDDDFCDEDASETRLSEVVASDAKKFSFTYDYDFGDSWEHKIVFEGSVPMEKDKRCPICLDGRRACPPEDIGGVWGYEEFLQIIADRNDERREEMLEWHGCAFDPEAFDADAATAKMQMVT
jgi:hypothetical protein